MVLTKGKAVIFTLILTVLYFVVLLFLPESIVGDRGDHLLLFLPKIMFLAGTAGIVTVLVFAYFNRREYFSIQMQVFMRYRHFLKLLVKRDFITKFRKSVLGVLWSLLNPLLTMTVMTIVFSFLFRDGIENFPVYLLSGLIIYNFFSESTSIAMSSIINSEGTIKKVYVPKYVFPLARVTSSLVNLGFSMLAFFLVFIVTGESFKWTLLLIPLPILYTYVFALGVAMFMSCLAVFFRDLTYLYGVCMLMLFYLSPVIYPVSILPDWVIPYYGLNPLFQFIEYFRSLTIYGIVPDLWENMVCIGFALFALCMGTFTFMKQQDKFILNL